MITWHEPKRLANIDKHGLDFADAVDFDWGGALVLSGHSGRFRAIGTFQGRVVAIVFTLEGNDIVVISMRPASVKERKAFNDR